MVDIARPVVRLGPQAVARRVALLAPRVALLAPRVGEVMLAAAGVAVIVVGVLLVTVGIGPAAERLRLVQTGWGVAVIAAGLLAAARRRPAAVRTILAGIITGSFAVGVADARGRPLTDHDLALPLLLGICFLGVEIAGLLGAPGAEADAGGAAPPPRP